MIALDRKPVAAKVAFQFNSNMPVRLTVTLARRVRVHRHLRWVPVGRPRTISAAAGRNSARLNGRKRLTPGTYRLTLSPAEGKAGSLVFHIG